MHRAEGRLGRAFAGGQIRATGRDVLVTGFTRPGHRLPISGVVLAEGPRQAGPRIPGPQDGSGGPRGRAAAPRWPHWSSWPFHLLDKLGHFHSRATIFETPPQTSCQSIAPLPARGSSGRMHRPCAWKNRGRSVRLRLRSLHRLVILKDNRRGLCEGRKTLRTYGG